MVILANIFKRLRISEARIGHQIKRFNFTRSLNINLIKNNSKNFGNPTSRDQILFHNTRYLNFFSKLKKYFY